MKILKRRNSGSSRSSSPGGEMQDINLDDQLLLAADDNPAQNVHLHDVDVCVIEGPHPSGLSGDTNENPSIQQDFTMKHPLGQILIAMLTENTKLADKCNMRDMTISMDELCRNFYNYQMLDKQRIKNNILQTTSNLENSIIERELNSHIINQSIAPPQRFSQVPTLLTAKQRADCMKLLPIGSNKFSGTDKGTSIVEYLHQLNSIQKNCKLSLQEFYDIMLGSTTGQAYLLIHSWIEGGETPETIYHNLLLHFDKRLQPEEARMQLMSYKAPRNSDLARVEAKIQGLASRASSNIPAGPSRIASYNVEVIQGLIRSLPLNSSLIVQNLNNEKSARLGRGLSAAELSRFLNTYRHSIDNDIKSNGIDPRFQGVAKRPVSRVGKDGSRNAVYGVRVTSGDDPLPRQTRIQQRPISPHFCQINQVSANKFRRPGGNRIFGTSPNMKRAWEDKYGIGNSKVQPKVGMQNYNGRRMQYQNNKRPYNNNKFANNPKDDNYCSLCGSKNHLAINGCPNMKSDSGQIVQILPSKDVCNACPAFVNPRLSHPQYLCPYRKTGPWGNKL